MNAASAPAPTIPPIVEPDAKILSDLSTVTEKIALCTSMLHPLTSTTQIESHPESDSFLAIIGFLEACVPRVRELIEAGMTGALKEDTVVKCLAVNDQLCQVLEFVEHPEKCQPSVASATQSSEKSVMDDFDAFGIGDDDEKIAATQPSEKAAKTLDDLLSSPMDTAGKTGAAIDPDVKKATDEFDDFFSDRDGKPFE